MILKVNTADLCLCTRPEYFIGVMSVEDLQKYHMIELTSEVTGRTIEVPKIFNGDFETVVDGKKVCVSFCGQLMLNQFLSGSNKHEFLTPLKKV